MAAAVGVLVSAGLALLIALVYSAVRKASGFGMGDVKLLAAIGIFLGPYGLLVLFVGSLAGAIAGIVLASRKESGLATKFPFGPFLAGAAVLVTFIGPALVSWYLGVAGLTR